MLIMLASMELFLNASNRLPFYGPLGQDFGSMLNFFTVLKVFFARFSLPLLYLSYKTRFMVMDIVLVLDHSVPKLALTGSCLQNVIDESHFTFL